VVPVLLSEGAGALNQVSTGFARGRWSLLYRRMVCSPQMSIILSGHEMPPVCAGGSLFAGATYQNLSPFNPPA